MGINPLKASSQSVTSEEELTKGIESLIDESVYQLYSPENVVPGVEVIFFHGLPLDEDYKKAYWKTWLSRDGSEVWPKEWLPGSLSNPRVLSVSYDASAREHEGAQDSYTIVERLIEDLILDEATRVGQGQNCPVILVGHSLGGIIIKELLLKCLTRRGEIFNSQSPAKIELINNFLGNCKGVFYYSTPHNGSAFVDYLTNNRVRLNGPLMKLLGILSTQTARINSEFAMVRYGEGFRTQAIAENLETNYMGFKGKLVEEGSARYDIESYYTAPSAGHFDVCKPKSKKSCSIYRKLLGFINDAKKDQGSGLRTRIVEPVLGIPVQIPAYYVPNGSEVEPSRIGRPGPSERNPRRNTNKQPRTEIDQPQVIENVNDSVWRLYTPQGVPKVVVILFHGLPEDDDYTRAYWKTWLSRDDASIVWPKEWLPKYISSPLILSVSYNSSASKQDGASDSYVIAENLIQDIILGNSGLCQDCPVILVGHGLGGIIIKQFLLACLNMVKKLVNNENSRPTVDCIEKFLQNCKGVFYYSTPHGGSELFHYVPEKKMSDLMKLLKKLSEDTARINNEFENARASARDGKLIRTWALWETLDTKYMGFNGRIVEEASARQGIVDALSYSAVDNANHFDVCKATNRSSKIFTMLLRCIETAMEDNRLGLGGMFLASNTQAYKR